MIRKVSAERFKATEERRRQGEDVQVQVEMSVAPAVPDHFPATQAAHPNQPPGDMLTDPNISCVYCDRGTLGASKMAENVQKRDREGEHGGA